MSIVTVAATGNPYIDGILVGTKWTGPVTYSFPDAVADLGTPYGHSITGFAQLNAAQNAAVRYIMGDNDPSVPTANRFAYGSFTDVANIDLNIAASSEDGSDIPLFELTTLDGQTIPTALVIEFPSVQEDLADGDVAFGNNNPQYRNPLAGNFAWVTHIHEIGHALGLAHGHDNGGPETLGVTIPTDREGFEFSVMSYANVSNDFIGADQSDAFGAPQTLMMLDIQALQTLYGANYAYNATDTVYTWSATTGEMFVNGVGQGQPGGSVDTGADDNKIFLTTWDGGGEDTYDMSNYTGDMHIDLAPGGWSLFSQAQRAVVLQRPLQIGVEPSEAALAFGNVYNALTFNGDDRSLIENAIGGAGVDWIEGNDADNRLVGNNSGDVLNGRAGDDILEGGNGIDTLFGDGRTGGPAFNGAGFTQVTGGVNSSIQTAMNLTGLLTRQFNSDVRDSDTNPHVSVDVFGNNNGQDFFQVDIFSPGLVIFDIDFGSRNLQNTSQQNFDAVMALFDEDGNLVSQSDESGVDPGSAVDLFAQPGNPNSNQGSEDPHIVYNVATPGSYFVGIDDAFGRGVFFGANYRLSITVPNFEETFVGGDDLLIGGAGGDQIHGGGGNDTLSYEGDTEGVTVRLFNGTASGGHAQNDVFTSIENLTGGSAGDFLTGNSGPNVLKGEGGNDQLRGGSGNDSLNGGDDDDILVGQNGDDVLEGGAGGDTIDGDAGEDTLSYASDTTGVSVFLYNGQASGGHATGDNFVEIEHLSGGSGGDTLVGNSAANTLRGEAGDDVLRGGSADDFLRGGADDDILVGQNGDDLLEGGSGADVMNGEAGSDTISYVNDTTGVSVRLFNGTASGGDATGDSFSGIENIAGGRAGDLLVGDAFANILRGNDGNDQLRGGSGDDILRGGADDDILVGHSGDDILEGGPGGDTIDGDDGADTLSYAFSATAVTVRLFNGTASGGDATGDNFVEIENVAGGSGGDLISGDAFANVLTGNGGRDQLRGGSGDDHLIGGDDDDILIGQNHDDVLEGGAGGDTMDGDDGLDTLSYASDTTGVSVRIFNGTVSGGHATGDSFVEIENLAGGSGGDFLVGNSGANVLMGEGGNDQLRGGSGADTLEGGSGDDMLFGQNGSDRLDGGDGDDMLEGGADGDVLIGGAGVDTASYVSDTVGVDVRLFNGSGAGGEAAGDVLSQVENVVGGSGGDFIAGNSAANYLRGGGGGDQLRGGSANDWLQGGSGDDIIDGQNDDDTVEGGAGGDTMVGGAGRDTLSYAGDTSGVSVRLFNGAVSGGDAAGDSFSGFENLFGGSANDYLVGDAFANQIRGEAGNDQVRGGSGNDVLRGGAGNDLYMGGADADRFVFDTAFDAGDRIIDFSAAEGDRILLDDALFAALATSGSSSGTPLAAAEFTMGAAATTAAHRIVATVDGADLRLFYDADGSGGGGAVAFGLVEGVGALTAGDFFVI